MSIVTHVKRSGLRSIDLLFLFSVFVIKNMCDASIRVETLLATVVPGAGHVTVPLNVWEVFQDGIREANLARRLQPTDSPLLL